MDEIMERKLSRITGLWRIKEIISFKLTRLYGGKRVGRWLEHGDKNTKFFHRKTEQRSKTNSIKKIKDEHGHWWSGEAHNKRLLINFFL